ncbi:hypothetical protein TSOC_006721 [Tetrabaena socialis]|uniref:Uncharacterized protein n=1 Tax=Tetrabaena socialis TaxID=47790 RepID=A0A2J8A2Y1_9CHLO|nr:hypothetical protein TSOC_006721 [Tetrabaena socialis]|eukprot:PNH06874.1 hypothetical protein TSOC_006721 [Tetrabaena socialis]
MASNDNLDQLDVLLQAVEEVVEQPEDLEGCEKLIEGSSLKNNFLRIGQALVTVNDRKLYKRAGSTSFTQYIEQKSDFGFGPRQALRLLAATRLVRNFPPTIALPTSERQVRALVGLEQQQAVKVWVKANLIAQETGVPLTHRLVESVLGKELPATYRQAARDWQVYINPPTGIVGSEPLQGLFLDRAIREVAAGRAAECLLFLKAAIGQRWFARALDHPHCWLSEKTAKKSAAAAAAAAASGEGGKSPRGMMVVYLGRRVKEFCDHFGDMGHIPGLNGWSGAKVGKD